MSISETTCIPFAWAPTAGSSMLDSLLVSHGCSPQDRCKIVGSRLDNHVALDADGTRGEVLLCWRSDRYMVDRIDVRTFSITIRCKPVGAAEAWSLTTVYGPHDSDRKRVFLNELADLHNMMVDPWITIGDFNLIKDLQDKNNDRINRT